MKGAAQKGQRRVRREPRHERLQFPGIIGAERLPGLTRERELFGGDTLSIRIQRGELFRVQLTETDESIDAREFSNADQ